MKKLYFTLLSIFSGLAIVTAQTVTVANHQPVVGDSYSKIQIDSTGILALSTATGNTAVWNFTTPNTRTVITGWYNSVSTYTPGSTVTSSVTYPGGTLAKISGGEKSFYSTSSSDLKFWGGNVIILGNTADFVLSSGVTQAIYPMQYGDFMNSSSFTGSIVSGFAPGTISGGSGNVTYDGLGTLNLAGRTFTNVVRLKTRTAFNFNLIVAGTITFENYDYYELSKSKHPLLTVSASTITGAGNSTQYYAYINKDYMAIGVNELTNEISNLNIYPNPSKSNFNISLTNENAEIISYEMINALGQAVKKENLGNAKGEVKFNIETTGIESGIYFVKVFVGKSSSVKKLTIQ